MTHSYSRSSSVEEPDSSPVNLWSGYFSRRVSMAIYSASLSMLVTKSLWPFVEISIRSGRSKPRTICCAASRAARSAMLAIGCMMGPGE